MESLVSIGVLLFFAVCVCGVILALTTWLGPRNPTAVKETAYECGVKSEGDERVPFKIHFYLVAVLFLLFDVEAAFLLPWALIYKESLLVDGSLFWGAMVYLGIVVLGLFYVFRKRALDFK